IREGWMTPGAHTRAVLQWASRPEWTITANMTGAQRGYVRIQIGMLDQQIELEARPRHFGGRQWFFICPHLNRRAMVLWKPPRANFFACRLRWGRQVAYRSQFLDRDNRTYRRQGKIRSHLCALGGFDAEAWELPPKPKWMRWKTYKRYVEKFERDAF